MRKKVVRVGSLKLKEGLPLVVKGMIKSSLEDRGRVFKEARKLKEEGAQIIRVAVEKEEALELIEPLKEATELSLEADIHFNYNLALASLEKNIDCLRLNPLNIYKKAQVRKIIRKAKEKLIPVRVGVNSGGFRKKMKDEALAQAMVKKLISYVRLLEEEGFNDILVSAKAESCLATILANQTLSKRLPYPINLGLTATGPFFEGLIKSSLTLGILIYQGIGSSLRVSLNSDSYQEVRVARWILQALGKRRFYPEIISCPSCSRCKVDLRRKVEEFKEIIYKNKDKLYNKNVRVALMGCMVNGPGEASSSDAGVAFGKRKALLFSRGKIIKRIKEHQALESLLSLLRRRLNNGEGPS